MHSHSKIVPVLILILLLTACTPAAPATPAGPAVLRVMTHDSFAVSDTVIQAFETANNARVEFIKSGDAGAMLNRAILTKSAPQADVIYGLDNTFLSRALAEDLLAPYASPELKNIPDALKLDPQNRALPVDYGDVCINYDRAWFASKGLALPQTLADLAKPEYRGLLVTEDPSTSSTGLAFLLATIAEYGPTGYIDYWKSLKANGLVVVNGWEAAYYTNFSGSTGKGAQPMVVSYGSSPASEVVNADTKPEDAPTASLVGKNMCFRQVEFVGLLKNGQNSDLAKKFIDFMLSDPFQADMPLQMYVYPANSKSALPESFSKYNQVPEQPASLSPDDISANRDAWLQAWSDAILK
jgi:thiamine transport system substrate-binding protein